jgi:uncharacterized membrane protein
VLLATIDDHTYLALLAVHVLMAAVWLGGGAIMAMLTARLRRDGSADALRSHLENLALVGSRIFPVAAVILIACGIGLVADGHWGFNHLWIQASLTIWVVSVALGIGFFGPQIGRAIEELDAQGMSNGTLRARIDRLTLVSQFDSVILTAALILMTVKPGG